jgi:threonine dehydrogenase-like Zn-dependent dehydrogenase
LIPHGPVLIVGAGPTGLVLAIELARRAVPFRLIAAPGHTMLLLLGAAKEDGAVDEALALASAAARLYRPHLQAYVVARDAVTAEDSSDMLLRDPAGARHERLGADRPCLCLTRPDGHLGLRAAPSSLEALQHHLARILIR